MVAVKIIEHPADVNSRIEALRETLVCSNINHPNVVSTYKVIACGQHSLLTGQQAGRLNTASDFISEFLFHDIGQGSQPALHSVGSSRTGIEDVQVCPCTMHCNPEIALVRDDIPRNDEPPAPPLPCLSLPQSGRCKATNRLFAPLSRSKTHSACPLTNIRSH